MNKYLKRQQIYYIMLALAMLSLSQFTVAQPSGGPYGPVSQSYEIPRDANKIIYVAPEADSDSKGKSEDKPTTIETAVSQAETGDVIILREGTYRTGNLIFNQGISLQPYKNEKVIFKGTKVADQWKPTGFGLWVTKWDDLYPAEPDGWWRRERNIHNTPLHRFNNDMVFVDGKFLQSASSAVDLDKNSFYIDYEHNEIYISFDPKDKLMEVTAYDVALHRTTEEIHGKKSDKKGFSLKGITLTQYAYRAIEIDGYNPEKVSPESEHGKDVVGTQIENCEISYCSRVAGYFRGDSLVIRNCKISDTSTEGIFVLSSNDVLLENNILTRNNIEKITGYYPAAVKIFSQCYRVTCNNNLVIDHPYSNGIWYDVGNVDGVFTNNWLQNVGTSPNEGPIKWLWPSENAFFFEISKGITVAGNVFVDNDHGLMILNSSDAHIYNNTFINSSACLARDQRSAEGDHFGWHPASGPGVEERDGHIFVNNLMYGDGNYQRPLLFTWQPDRICERVSESPFQELDHNVYVKNTPGFSFPPIVWGPASNDSCQIALESPEALNALYPDHSENSLFLEDYQGPLFQSRELDNYKVHGDIKGDDAATELPEEVRKLIGTPQSKFIGAHPQP